MSAAPLGSACTWMKSSRPRSPPVVQAIPNSQIWPVWTGYSETFAVVKLGAGFAAPELVTALIVCAIYTFHVPLMKPAPQGSPGQEPSVGVPYQTMSTRPALPATSHGKTFVCNPPTWLDTLIGFVHVAPLSLDVAR